MNVLWLEPGLRTSCSEVRRPGLSRLPGGLEGVAPGVPAHRSPATSGARSPALTLVEFLQDRKDNPCTRLPDSGPSL